jgi:hypothetical protein
MPLTPTGRNNLLTDGLDQFTHVGLLVGVPSLESTAARQAVAWNAASGGIRDNNADLSLPANPSETILAGAFWNASSAGVQQGYFALGSTLRGVGTAEVNNIITSHGHGLIAGDRLFMYGVAGEALPTGLVNNVVYWVISENLTLDTFEVSLTSGGATVDITAVGELAFSKTIPEVFSPTGGNVILIAGALDLDMNFV